MSSVVAGSPNSRKVEFIVMALAGRKVTIDIIIGVRCICAGLIGGSNVGLFGVNDIRYMLRRYV